MDEAKTHMDVGYCLLRRLIRACADRLHIKINGQSTESIIRFVKFALIGIIITIDS